jgi:hypothetical protein
MTKERDFSGSTKFSKWLRDQKELDSNDGFITTDLDYIWSNYKTKQFMLIEEKCQMQEIRYPQSSILKRLHLLCKADKKYLGFYQIKFQLEYPEDGGDIWLNKIKITKEQLIKFLKFDISYKELKNNIK